MKTFNRIVPVVAASLLLAGCNSTKAETFYYGFGSTATYTDKAATTDSTSGAVTAGATVQTDVSVASVLFNAAGEIVDLNVDVMQVKAGATSEDATTLSGSFNDDSNSDVKSKWELGDAYNMKTYGGAIAEWYQEAKSFEDWAVGKTVSDLSANLTDYEGGHALTDGASIGTTINVDPFIETITNAWNAKKEFSGSEGKVGLGMYNSHADTQDDVTIGGAVFDSDGKIQASNVDVYQIPYVISENASDSSFYDVTVDTSKSQVNATDLSLESKVELGDSYNMKTYGGALAEWYEEAANLEAYAVGKTVAEVFAAANINEDGEFVDGATIGTTIGVTDFAKVYAEAYANAQNADR